MNAGVNPIRRFFRYFFFDHWRKIDAETMAPVAGAADAASAASADGGRARVRRGKGGKDGRAGKDGKDDKDGKDGRDGKAGAAAAAGAEAPAARATEAGRGYAWQVIVILVTVAVSLSMQEYYGERNYFRKAFPPAPGDDYYALKQYVWWSGWRFFGYVVIPMMTLLAMPGERIRDYYVSPRGFFRHLWIYVVLFALILPVVVIASRTDAFRLTYPFYKMANRSAFDFWAWQGLYWLQFLSLEFFFRGYILHGLSRVMGSKAIFVMIVPYCMIHFGKPFSETIGAIGAGIILGTLAMRTRSIWGGVIIHVAVAFTMDYLALSQCPSWVDTGKACMGH